MHINYSKENKNNADLKLWYRQPALCWKEALPLGNGRMGAMIYGNPDKEVIDLTDVTCFSGEASTENNTEGAPEHFNKARKALLNKDYDNAKQHINRFIGKRLNYGTNLPLGHLLIQTGQPLQVFNNYTRFLQLDSAVSSVAYSIEGTRFEHSAFMSNPHQILVIKIISHVPGKLDLLLSLDGGDNPHRVDIDENKDFLLYGTACESIHSDGKTGTAFHGRLRVIAPNAQIEINERKIHIYQAEEILILISIGTDFDGMDMINDCRHRIDQTSLLSYDELLNAHIKDYKSLFNRVAFSLGTNVCSDIPTDILLQQAKDGIENPSLTALMFQYGRYLLIASSRANSPLPPHLQGVWNDSVASHIGWTCDMHLDINTQMNYWPAEVTNLSECHAPLFKWIENKLLPSGRITAKKSYGLNGWVAELVSNAWGFTAPYWHYNLSPCPTGGVWVATHMWEHYLFTGDIEFLKEHTYPVIREATEFFIEYIFIDTNTGFLTSGPSVSPENTFMIETQEYSSSIGPTYEIVMIRELFNIFLKASENLETKDTLVDRVKFAVDKLQPFEIDSNGELKEWSHSYKSKDPQHRHTSHLFSLFPFSQITPEKTPELAEAARLCIKRRVTPEENWEDTGWARSMLMLYSARLQEKDKVYEHVLSMQRYLTNNNLMIKHPPTRGAPSFADVYELDGNTGLTACIAESLLQSHQDEIHLLPALPTKWANGCIKGLCARGGFEVDIEWKDCILQNAAVYSNFNNICRIRYGSTKISFNADAGSKYLIGSDLRIHKDI